MPMVTFGKTTYTLDDYGFLEQPGFWDEEFAESMAYRVGLNSGLSEDHWRVIRYLRHKLLDEDSVPFFVTACIETGLHISEFKELFPTGYMRGACRLAGLSYSVISERNLLQTLEVKPSIWLRYELTPLGFLKDVDRWDETFANMVASEWDLPCGLTEAHWKVLRFLRSRFAETGSIPLVYETCQANNLSLKDLRSLFPGGYRRGACRMAGLPLDA